MFSPLWVCCSQTVRCCMCVQDVAQQLLPLVAPALLSAGGTYGIVGHSMGCWMAYELVLALRKAGAALAPRVLADA